MPKIEPEIIKQWREEFKLRTDKIEADADQEVKEIIYSTQIFLTSLAPSETHSQYKEGPREVKKYLSPRDYSVVTG